MDGEHKITLGPTRPWPLIQALFWSAEALGGVAAMVGGPYLFASGEVWYFSLPLALGGLVLFYLGLAMAGLSWMTALSRGPVIAMSAAGLRDVRVSPALIPWREFEWGLLYAGMGSASIQFEVPRGITVRWPARLLAPLNRMAGCPPYTMLSLGTGKSAAEIAALLRSFRDAKY